LKGNVDVDENNTFILHKAIEQHNMDKIKFCLHGWDPFLENSEGVTSIHLALLSEDDDIKKETAKAVCRQFMIHINQMQTTSVYKVWLGCIPRETIDFGNLRIVVLYNEHSEQHALKKFRGIPIYWRQKDKVSEEAKATIHLEDIECNTKRQISGEDAARLFKEHSNLNMIHPSSFKSTKFFTVDSTIVQIPCIALYCKVKGIIPLGERAFPNVIGDLNTDVREGYVIFGQDHLLRPGTEFCCTSSMKSGTIGGFVELEDGSTALITASHILVTSDKLGNDSNFNPTILISRGSNQADIIGKVIRGRFWNANPNESSVDAALIRINKTDMAPDFSFPTTDEELLGLKGTSIMFPF